MKIQVEFSLYPLKTGDMGEMINRFLDELTRNDGLTVSPGDMSSRVTGEAEVVFLALSRVFNNIVNESEAVLVLKASNGCPNNSLTEEK